MRITTIVIFLVLQRTPAHVNGVDGYSEVAFGGIYKRFFFISTIDPIKKVNFVTNHIPDFYAIQLLQHSPSRPC